MWATGHYRNGILLADVTAEAVVSVLAGDGLPEWAAPCDPARFAEVRARERAGQRRADGARGGRDGRGRAGALELPGGERGVAVAVDAEVVPRGEWPAHELSEGARVEVLRAIQGG